ncbi:MAG: C40 family peptidase [Spirochaetales bacterium]|nr:C40 family peptidase [Spirochaetales bacterium]
MKNPRNFGKLQYYFILLFIFTGISFCFSNTIELQSTGPRLLQLKILEELSDYLSVPYEKSGLSKGGIDDLGLLFRVYKDVVGVLLPRDYDKLWTFCQTITSEIFPGDLVFFDFNRDKAPDHCGVYLGDTRFIHSSNLGRVKGVVISSLQENQYQPYYLGARRLLDTGLPLIAINLLNETKKTGVYPNTLRYGFPCYFRIINRGFGDKPLVFIAENEKGIAWRRNIQFYTLDESDLFWFVPDKENWSITLLEGDKTLIHILFY